MSGKTIVTLSFFKISVGIRITEKIGAQKFQAIFCNKQALSVNTSEP